MGITTFTELTKEGRKGLEERFPEFFREKETKYTYAHGNIPYVPRCNEETGAWTVIIRRVSERSNWRRIEDRDKILKEAKVRIPDEWVHQYQGSDRCESLERMLRF